MGKLISILLAALLIGCNGSTPVFQNFNVFDEGCGISFKDGDSISTLNVSSSGKLIFHSRTRELASNPDVPGSVGLRLDRAAGGHVLLVVNRMASENVTVGYLGDHDLDALKGKCPIEQSLIMD